MVLEKLCGLGKSKTNGGISRGLLFFAAFASILWSVYFALVTISMPYQIELREGTAQVMTEFLLDRNNPFQLENQPLAMNNYGLGYNLVVSPFAALFGNTLLVHRSVTFVFVLLSALTGFMVVYRSKREAACASACAAFIVIGLMARGGIGAFPSAMGTFLFMMTIVLPFLRGFDRTSLLLSILFSIAAFYSKAYFVLGFGIVASYLFLFVSRKTGLFYSLLFLLLFAVSLLGVRLAFPLYLINTIIGNMSNTDISSAHLVSQLMRLLFYFFPVLVVSLFLMASENGLFNRSAARQFNSQAWQQLLTGAVRDYFFFSSVCALLAFIFVLGPHIGGYLNYAYQLILPVFFCWFFLKFDPHKQTGVLMVAAVIFNLFVWGKDTLHPQMLEQRNSKEWETLYSYVRSSSNILNSPVIASVMIESGLNPLDSGQTAYFYSVKPYPMNALLGPPYDAFRTDGFRYIKSIDNAIEKQKFDLIVTTREKSSFYHAKLIKKFYVLVDEIKVAMPQTDQQWTLLLWKPFTR